MHLLAVTGIILLAIVAGMYLLAKTKQDQLGMFFKLISYTVVLVGIGCLICCLIHCVHGMGCNEGSCMKKEVRVMKMHHGGGMEGNCMHGGMQGCDMHGGDMKCGDKHGGDMKCCDEHGSDMKDCKMHDGEMTDTIVKKEVKKVK